MPVSQRLILASSSPTRRTLLERLRVPFETCTPGMDESAHAGEAPDALAGRLARAKALLVAAAHPDALVIGADQVAVVDGQRLDKPGEAAHAAAHLRAASGRTVLYYTGLCLHNATTGTNQDAVVVDRVTLRVLDETMISRYLALEQPFDCAGALRSEGLGIALCTRMESVDPTALLGLPLLTLVQFLAREGVLLP